MDCQRSSAVTQSACISPKKYWRTARDMSREMTMTETCSGSRNTTARCARFCGRGHASLLNRMWEAGYLIRCTPVRETTRTRDKSMNVSRISCSTARTPRRISVNPASRSLGVLSSWDPSRPGTSLCTVSTFQDDDVLGECGSSASLRCCRGSSLVCSVPPGFRRYKRSFHRVIPTPKTCGMEYCPVLKPADDRFITAPATAGRSQW